MSTGFVAERRAAYGGYNLACCYYCGQPAESVDHVIPQSMLRDLAILGDPSVLRLLKYRLRYKTVPSCRWCNSSLGNKYFDTIAKRRAWVKNRLRRKYRDLLAMPDWTDSELGQLAPPLRNYVLLKLDEKRLVKERLAWQEPLDPGRDAEWQE